jgi:hypothetical protein
MSAQDFIREEEEGRRRKKEKNLSVAVAVAVWFLVYRDGSTASGP